MLTPPGRREGYATNTYLTRRGEGKDIQTASGVPECGPTSVACDNVADNDDSNDGGGGGGDDDDDGGDDGDDDDDDGVDED